MKPASNSLLLPVAGLLFAGSCVAFGWLWWAEVSRVDATGGLVVQLRGTAFDAPPAPASPARVAVWSPPAPQSRGREWIYDLFTSPEIFYHARTKQFTVRPPATLADDEADEPFGLELRAVRPEPFRLQLIGYVGGEGNWRGTFENVLTGEVFLAGAGHHVGKLGVTIAAIEVRQVPVALPQSMTTRQRVAFAVVRDERAGGEVTLTHRERVTTGRLSAIVAVGGAEREVRAGDNVEAGGATFRIDRIELSPPALEVTKRRPGDAQPDRRVLSLVAVPEPESPLPPEK